MVTMAFSFGGRHRPFTVSPNFSVGLPNGAAVTDARGIVWRVTGGNQISVNGVTDTTTSGVTRIILVTPLLWQLAPTGWYSKALPSDTWTFSSGGPVSASATTINLGDTTSGIVDARGFVWMLTAGGSILTDGTVDPVTHDVTQLEYFGGQIWQDTATGWYKKTLPTDAWVSSATAPGVAVTAVILGAQLGNPDGGASVNDGGSGTYFEQFYTAMNEAPTLFITYANQDYGGDFFNPSVWGGVAWGNIGGIINLNALPNAAPITIACVGMPIARSQPTNADDFTSIQNGGWDNLFNAVFDNYGQRGQRAVITRPGWEMNGGWEPWSKGNASDRTDAYYAGFRGAYAYLAQYGYNWAANNQVKYPGMKIETCWNPGFLYGGDGADYVKLYPGDAYVDHIGIDTYGPYSDGSGGGSSSGPLFVSPVGNNNYFSLDDACKFAIAHGKPLSFPEVGGSPGETTFQNNIATTMANYPSCRVSFVGIWDQPTGNGPPNTTSLWSTNTASGAAWKAMMASIRSTRTA